MKIIRRPNTFNLSRSLVLITQQKLYIKNKVYRSFTVNAKFNDTQNVSIISKSGYGT